MHRFSSLGLGILHRGGSKIQEQDSPRGVDDGDNVQGWWTRGNWIEARL